MKTPLKVLLAEDNPADAELVLRELRRAGFEPAWERVDSESEFRARLRPDLDIILSDYDMPQFGGPRALELVQERGLEIPFIIISGTIGEDTAVVAMKLGAADYLLKDRLTRLGPAVSHALEQARMRRERQQAVKELRLFRALIDHSDDTFEVIDPDSARFLDINEQGCADLGYSRAEFLALRVWEVDPLVAEADWPHVREKIRAAGDLSREGLRRRKDGSTYPVELNARWVALDREYIVAVVRDITVRQRTEERVREQAAMLDLAHEAIFVRGFRDRRVSYWNQGAANVYGWSEFEAMGKDAGELIYIDPYSPDEIRAALLAKDEWRGETRHRTKQGRELIVSSRQTLLRDASGAPKSVLSINADVTEQKALEARYRRAQRMESVGTLASGMAHDLNNVLAPIMMTVPALRNKLTDERREEAISIIEVSAQRGSEIIKQVLTFGQGLEGERRPLHLAFLIREMKKMMCGTFASNIAISTTVEGDLWPVLGDATQIHQVLLNLCVNARDAMPDGGRLVLRAANFHVDAMFASMLPWARPGAYVLLEVTDSGSGIPPEIVERIFDPFFTTKGDGQGTGLGLSTTLGIVKSHRGFIQVQSQMGQGSTLQVYLPASPGHGLVPAEPPADAPSHRDG